MKLPTRVVIFLCLLNQTLCANTATSVSGTVDGWYGSIDSRTTKGLEGSISIPLAESCGVQLGGLYSKMNPRYARGIGVHAFYRDSSVGLLGLTAMNSELNKTDATRLGIGGEYYLNQFTISGYIGYQFGDIDNSGYGQLSGGYYPLDDLMFTLSVATSDSIEYFALGAEYETPNRGVSLYVSLATGEKDYNHAFFGFKSYIGPEVKTLIKRHREDAPTFSLFKNIIDIARTGLF